MLLHETCFFRGERVEVRLDADFAYYLSFGDAVTYSNGFREVRGKRSSYVFRSVEQLRYDFERDVAAVGGTLG
jgi:hypothetical protein